MIFKDCIFELESGKREKGGALKSGVPSLGAEHLNECGSFNLDLSKMKYISYDFFCKMRKGKVRKGDIILVKDGATTGKVSFVDDLFPFENVAVNEHVFLIRTKDGYFSKYVFYLLFSEFGRRNVLNDFRGATVGGISKEFVNFDVSIPSMEEQRNIVNKLDILQHIIDLRKKQINGLEEIIKSQFVEMFGDIKDTQYDVLKLKDLTNLITDGEHKKPNYTENGKPFISVVNITTGDLKFNNCKFVSNEDTIKFQKRCKPEKNDILYTKVGATYGRSAIVDTDEDFSLYVSVCLIKPKRELINPIFLNYTMRQPYVKMQADKCIKGIGVPDLHLIEIKNFNVIVPPIKLQNQFEEFVKQISKLKFEIQKSLEKIQSLQENLMNKYFN